MIATMPVYNDGHVIAEVISMELCPTFGLMLLSMRYVFDEEMWKFILRRWNYD